MKTQFNTGRRYTAEGQVIVAVLGADGHVEFHDHSRGIAGRFTPAYPPTNETQLRSAVMVHYDANKYEGITPGPTLRRDDV